MRLRNTTALAAASGMLIALALASTARADDSQIKISEVYSDACSTNTPACKTDFVELQLAAAGQQITAGDVVRLYNATALATISFAFPASTIASDNQRTVLLGWDTNAGADFQVSSGLNPPAPAGAACLLHADASPVDCVAWGGPAFTGGALVPTAGAAFASPLNAAQSLNRNITRGCATLLDDADDTNSSAADFLLAGATPRNNDTFPSEAACPLVTVKKCKKKKHHNRSAQVAKKKKCKKKHHKH
jgi:hypothetical protein